MTEKHGGARPRSQRQLRVGEELRHVLADLFRRGEFRDPGLQNLNVTVTEVRVSPDLRNATAFVTPLGGEQIGETVSKLRHASAFLRGQIAREIDLRYVPTLSFEADTSPDLADTRYLVVKRALRGVAAWFENPAVRGDVGDYVVTSDGKLVGIMVSREKCFVLTKDTLQNCALNIPLSDSHLFQQAVTKFRRLK